MEKGLGTYRGRPARESPKSPQEVMSKNGDSFILVI